MNALYRLAALALVVSMAACSGSAKEQKGELNDKKVQLQQLKDQQTKLAADIKKLEDEIALLDSTAVIEKLVAVTPITTQNFEHFIDLQGEIITDNIYSVSSRVGPMQSSQIKAVYVKQGDMVRKGQLLLKLDDGLLRQQIEQAKINLNHAKDLYQRRKNLWDQNIGTEVELINARNNVANMEKQLELLTEQLSFTNVYAEVGGVVETMNARVGGQFTGAPGSEITIVNPSNLKASVDIPEAYISQVRKGTPVVVEVPDVNKQFNTNISRLSTLINPNSRGFTAEAKLPGGANVKPNQLAIIKIKDYAAANVVVVPINTIQTDEKGKYVFVMVEEKGKKIARKRPVAVGGIYGERIEIKQGLQPGEQLITEGFQGLYDGQVLTTEVK
ncbi:MAG TPA: efflux RND transporter periplasmic adaptor subunit [Chitinophagaceae bacterium]|nr:efflux RND transporter periplasmic adaptor subunit [Chitinophagaceae bacterium]